MHKMWEGLRGEEFYFEEQLATILYPTVTPNGRMVLKTEYLDAFPEFDKTMLNRGYYVINITHTNRWASTDTIDQMARFVRAMAEKLNTNEKCILEGMSCGGLQAATFARLYPELTAVIYLDAPVMNLLSLAGLGVAEYDEGMWREMSETYGFDKVTVINFRESPIDYLPQLHATKLPIIMLYGNADRVVPYDENGKLLENYYKTHGGTLKVMCRSMEGHHPHGLKDPTPLVEFIEQHLG